MAHSNRFILRDATRPAHDRAEAHWASAGGFADLAVYQDWLRAMYRAHARVGLPAARALGDPSLLRVEMARLAALRADLKTADTATGPRACTISWAWGAQYVLNGSALGARHLLRSGTVSADWPMVYLKIMESYAKGGHLQDFFRALDQAKIDLDAALKGALAAFPAPIDARLAS